MAEQLGNKITFKSWPRRDISELDTEYLEDLRYSEEAMSDPRKRDYIDQIISSRAQAAFDYRDYERRAETQGIEARHDGHGRRDISLVRQVRSENSTH